MRESLLLPHPVILSEASQSDAKSKDPEDARFTTTAQTFSPEETHPPLTKLNPETPPHGRSLPEPRFGPPLTHILPRLCAKHGGRGYPYGPTTTVASAPGTLFFDTALTPYRYRTSCFAVAS